jgi:TPR repeat protein
VVFCAYTTAASPKSWLGRAAQCCAAVVFLIALSIFAAPANAQDASGKRLALVVGNAAYSSLPPLKQSTADAKLIQKSLADLGFEVTFVEDASKDALEQSLATLRESIVPESTVVVYFAGHGIQVSDQNYLAPVDVKVNDALDVPNATVSTTQVLDKLDGKGAAAVVLILDASRQNPFAKKKIANSDAVSDGLARISAVPPAMLVAFSTAPGGWSKQGSGDNSPYAEALAAALKSKGKNVEQIFKLARARVVVATAGEQIPWEKSALVQNVMFVPEVNQPAVATPDACDLAAGHPSDPERVGPSVEYASLDPQIAIPACEKAVAAHPENMRFKALLARALDKAGRGEEAAALNLIVMKAGYLDGYHNMGNLYRKGLGVEKDVKKAFELYMYAAERGHPEDQSNVGYMYMRGEGVDVDYKQAMVWLTKATAQNWATAYDKIGLLYLNGWGVKKDAVRAFEAFGKGANLGNAPSMVNYANCYKEGVGTEQDFKKAYHLYAQAAHLGNAAAYSNLGYLSLAGQGVKKDLAEAAFWFTLASREGNEDAQKQLVEVTPKLSEDQKQELADRLEEWSTERFG